jgi:hypothetical protein
MRLSPQPSLGNAATERQDVLPPCGSVFMFEFKLEPEIALLTVTRTGFWSMDTVSSYERILREELAALHECGPSTAFIIDIRSSGAQAKNVADALRAMVGRLGHLHADRTAVIASFGLAKLQARRVADEHAQVFSSMARARDWVMGSISPTRVGEKVYNLPSEAERRGPRSTSTVHRMSM